MNQYFVYILTSKKNGTLYYEHKSGTIKGFTKKYNINQLVYYESIDDVNEAIIREKRLKKRKS